MKRINIEDSDDVPDAKRMSCDAQSVRVAEFYEKEDRLAETMTMKEIYASFKEQIEKLRCCLMTSQPSVDTVLTHFIAIRRLNRLAQFRIRLIREDLVQRRSVIDERYLQLLNVKSEIQHLRNEVERCYDFRSADEDIDLVPLEEFYANAPVAISRPECTKEDPHEQRLARLAWERMERMNLLATLQELEGRRNVLMTDITTKEHRIRSVKPLIENVIETMKPVQELMGFQIYTKSSRESRRMFVYLPKELAVIAVQMEAMCDLTKDTTVTCEASGDLRDMNNYMNDPIVTTSLEETICIESSESEDSRSRRLSFDHGKFDDGNRIVAHPIHLILRLAFSDSVVESVVLTLQYIPVLRCIAAVVKLSPALPQNTILNEDHILVELFPSDDGSRCPNSVGCAKLEKLGISLEDCFTNFGRMFDFVQRIAGLNSNGTRSLMDACHEVVLAIQYRIGARCALHNLTRIIRENENVSTDMISEILPNLRNQFPRKIYSKIIHFQPIQSEQFFEHSGAYYSELMQAEISSKLENQMFFAAVIERSSSTKLFAFIFVGVTYPKFPPLFILELHHEGYLFTAENALFLRHFENEINCNCSSYVRIPNETLILHAQICFLLSRFDALLEFSFDRLSPNVGFPKEYLFMELSRGRDQQLPLHYDETSAAFSFRAP